jgi:hypothetical protein
MRIVSQGVCEDNNGNLFYELPIVASFLVDQYKSSELFASIRSEPWFHLMEERVSFYRSIGLVP